MYMKKLTPWILLGSLVLLVVIGSGLFIFLRSRASATNAGAPGGIPANISGLHVVGNTIKNSLDQAIQIRGVDRESPEYACIQGWGFGHGPFDEANVRVMKSWGVDAVRIPLNEDCWLGINQPADKQYSPYSSYFGAA